MIDLIGEPFSTTVTKPSELVWPVTPGSPDAVTGALPPLALTIIIVSLPRLTTGVTGDLAGLLTGVFTGVATGVDGSDGERDPCSVGVIATCTGFGATGAGVTCTVTGGL